VERAKRGKRSGAGLGGAERLLERCAGAAPLSRLECESGECKSGVQSLEESEGVAPGARGTAQRGGRAAAAAAAAPQPTRQWRQQQRRQRSPHGSPSGGTASGPMSRAARAATARSERALHSDVAEQSGAAAAAVSAVCAAAKECEARARARARLHAVSQPCRFKTRLPTQKCRSCLSGFAGV
jgi:hypothetical protein